MTTVASAAPAPLARRTGGRAPLARLTWQLSRPQAQSLAAIALPAVAFAVTTALMLVVLGGVLMFWGWAPDADGLTGFYQFLSLVALALLIVPLLSLGGAAARLSARRRDDRLATMRLLGATPGFVTAMTVLESVAVAVLGAVVGVVLYALLLPAVGLIPFRGSAIGAASLWVGPWPVVLVVLGIAVLAALSAAIGMRRVNVSPLGVRSKERPQGVHWVRLLITVVILGVALGLLNFFTAPSIAIFVGIAIGSLAAGVGVLALIGPWAIGVHARSRARRAKTPARLIGARMVLESPQAAWRQVGGMAMTTFVAVAGGAGMALADSGMAGATGAEAYLFSDIRTGILITLVVSFVMVACSVGVNQAAAILDRRALYVSLDRIGMPRSVMEEARVRATMGPLLFTVVISAIVGGLLVFPMIGASLLFAPLSVLVVVCCFAIGIGLVALALAATRPVLSRVLATPERAE